MGLSGRRRAKPENRQTKPSSTSSSSQDCHQTHRENRRLGHTYRRVTHKEARERKHTNLLSFDINRGWSNDLLPAEQPTHPEIGASPNANLFSRSMIRLMEEDFASTVAYSLNKRHRWNFTKQLTEEYDNKDQLKSQNIFFSEAVARGRKQPAVRQVLTNTAYTVEAADELRKHQKELRKKISRLTSEQKRETKKHTSAQLKQQVLQTDRFEFSDRVKASQTERNLVSTASATSGGSINLSSIKRNCNLWNHLYNVSPNAEEARLSLQRDFEGRMTISVGTCVPSPHVDVRRCTQSEKDTKQAKLNDRQWPTPRQRERMIQKQRRSEMEMQLDMDGEWSLFETPANEVDDGDCAFTSPTTVVPLVDFARPKISVNRDKKLAAKARKLRLQQMEQKRKHRNTSNNNSGGSSGYDSGSDGSENKDEAATIVTKETEPTDVRLLESLRAALSATRPIVQMPRTAAETTRISELFSDASLKSALVVSASMPRKLAVMLQPDLSETVVFEEIESEIDSEFTRFAVYHVCRTSDASRTTACEVASQTDSFEFLRQLLVDVSVSGRALERSVGKRLEASIGSPIAGWKHATTMTESVARLTAIRALPMFKSQTNAPLDAELVPAPDCEICCQQLSTGDSVNSFADGATMLSECGHRFCNSCWLQHVSGSIARGRADVSCPGFQCKTALDAATLLWFCPADLVSALASAAFRSWLSERCERRQRRLCPRPSCGRVLECRAGVNAVCDCSGRGLCVGCGQEPHWPCDCATAAKYRSKMKSLGHEKLEHRDLNAETNVNAKQCPSCLLVMEKGIGCNHMSCPCGEHFCWWCGQPMRAHNGAGPCNGGRGNSRSEFRVQRVFTAQDSFLVPNSTQSRLYCAAMRARISRGSSNVSLVPDGSFQTQLAHLFTSHAIRFKGVSWSTAGQLAREASVRLVRATVHASYLVEYSYAYLDSHRADRRTSAAVRALGSHIAELVAAISTEVKEQCRRGFRGPKQTLLAYERLMMMQSCLESKCRLLHCIVSNQRERSLVRQNQRFRPLKV